MSRHLIVLTVVALCFVSPASAGDQDSNVPDLSGYDIDTLRTVAEQLYRRVAMLEDQVKTLKRELQSLEDQPKTSIRVESQAPNGNLDDKPSDARRQRLERFLADAQKKRVAEIERSLREARMRLRQNRPDQHALQRVKDLQRSLSKVKSDQSTWLPDLWSTGFRIGRFGRLGRYESTNTSGRTVKVRQVIDGQQMLVVATYLHRPFISRGPSPTSRWSGRPLRGTPVVRETDAVWVRGVDTSGMVDDQTLDWEKGPIFEVTGTTTYETTIGGSTTVYVVEPCEP